MDLAVTAVRTALNGVSYVSPTLAGKAAFRLFRKPRGRSRLRPDERPVMDRAEVGEIAVGGERAVSYRWGTGERPVLLVHGWESRGSRSATLVSELLDLGLSPIAFDAPGHGEATGETMTILDLRDIIAALDAEHGPFEMVVAHSLGVTATFVAVRERGVRTERIVAISGVPDFAYLVDRFCAGLGPVFWIRPDQGAPAAAAADVTVGAVDRKAEEGDNAEGVPPVPPWGLRGSWRPTTTRRGAVPGTASPARSERQALEVRARLNRELRGRIERELFPGEGDIWSRFSVPREEVGGPAFLVVHDEDDDMVDPADSHALVAALGDRAARLVLTRGLGSVFRILPGSRSLAPRLSPVAPEGGTGGTPCVVVGRHGSAMPPSSTLRSTAPDPAP